MQSAPAIATLAFERLRLPGDEAVGLLSASYVIETSPGWWLGPALYGAATGHRGGLFTWGVEAQRRVRFGHRWEAAAGLYVGGGGGAGAPVGGGLMLRPHVDLMFDLGGWSAGVSATHVRFPSGSIRSTQVGLLMSVQSGFAFTAPGHGKTGRFDDMGGVGVDRVTVGVGHYRAGAGLGNALGYVGVRMDRGLGDVWSATLEGSGAATGGADGYAEFLGGASALWPVGGRAVRVGGRLALGLGGGGAVATGGGLIAKLALASRIQLASQPGVSLDIDVGRARAFSGDFSTSYAQISLGVEIDHASPRPGPLPRAVHEVEWALSVQDYLGARRKDGSERSMSAVGLKFRRAVGEHVYVTGQAHSAITGGAGAYSAGLVGLGATTPVGVSGNWRLEGEAMVGAGGGGGVAIRGGLLVQPMVSIGRDLGRHSRVKVGAGYVRSARGDLSSPVVDLSWAVAFGVP